MQVEGNLQWKVVIIYKFCHVKLKLWISSSIYLKLLLILLNVKVQPPKTNLSGQKVFSATLKLNVWCLATISTRPRGYKTFFHTRTQTSTLYSESMLQWIGLKIRCYEFLEYVLRWAQFGVNSIKQWRKCYVSGVWQNTVNRVNDPDMY